MSGPGEEDRKVSRDGPPTTGGRKRSSDGGEPRGLRHPFWQAMTILVGSWILIRFGIPLLPPLLGAPSAPVPGSVVLQYMLTAAVGILLYVSADETRWRHFRAPIGRVLADPDRRGARLVLFATLPLLAGFVAWRQVGAAVGAPPSLRSVHPAPPNEISFRGRTLRLPGLENPLRGAGERTEHLATGARVYVRNCVPCHGDRLDGQGHFAHAFNPVPADFTSSGTIAQLAESYVFWRIAKGGPGLPKEGTPWNSAMPAWEEVLTEEEIWSVILYMYERTGWTPRTWEIGGAEGEH